MEENQQPASANAWFVVHANPAKYYSWAKGFDYETASVDDFTALAKACIDAWFDGKKQRDEEKAGAMAVVEMGDGGLYHIHSVHCSEYPVSFERMRAVYPHSHIVAQRGNIIEATDYIRKEGKHADKAHTTRSRVVSRGKYFCDNKTKGARDGKVFEQIENLLANGCKPSDLYAESTKYSFYANAIERTYAARRALAIPADRAKLPEWETCWIYGHSATGKTQTYRDLIERHGLDQIYYIHGSWANKWDGYQVGTPILVADDFRPGDFSRSELLAIFSGEPMTCPARYFDRQAAWTKVYFLSVYPPRRYFEQTKAGGAGGDDSRDAYFQLARRLSKITYTYTILGNEGQLVYKSVSLPGVEFPEPYAVEEIIPPDDVKRFVKPEDYHRGMYKDWPKDKPTGLAGMIGALI